MSQRANIVTLDIEIAPNKVFTWGFYEQNVIKVIKPWYVLTIAYKWLHESTVHVLSLHHYSLFKKDHQNDRDLIRDIWKILDKADIVVTQNGDDFDIKKLNTRFLKHGLPPPSPFKSVDIKKVGSSKFAFVNNKLGNVGEELDFGGKLEHEGFPMWERAMSKNLSIAIKALKKMCRYNKRDVVLTEKIYLKERPWMTNHPNMNVYEKNRGKCPRCSSERVIKRGEEPKSTGVYQRYQCRDCGKWIEGELLRKHKIVFK